MAHGPWPIGECAYKAGIVMVEWIIPLTDLVVTGLLLVVGGNLGSFLNVVVHRLPRGESVVHGGSHCPACGSAIRWHDNVPVFGWLFLRGRCRDCSAMIAARYPLVEAVGAVFIGGVAASELLSGGRTLPGAVFGGGRPGADNLLLRPDGLLIAVAILHGWLLFNLLLGAAVEADGRLVPAHWFRMALGITLAAVVSGSAMLPVGVGIGGADWMSAGPGRGVSIAVCGMLCGVVAGATSTPAGRQGLVLIGAALGWQAAACIALLRPVFGWLRSLLASLIPPEPPAGPGDATDVVAAPFPESVRTDSSSSPAHVPSSTEPGPSPPAEVGAASAPRPGPRRQQGPLLIRLAEPISRQLRRRDLQGGDLLLATAVFLVAWRGLWRMVAG